MSTIIKIKKSSVQFQNQQKNIIVYILNNYFKQNLTNKSGQYLGNVDLTNISYNWCYDFVQNDDGIYGAWNPSFVNSIFLRPSTFNEEFRKYCEQKNINLSQMSLYNTQKKFYDEDFIKIKNGEISSLQTFIINKAWIKNLDKYNFIKYLLESLNLMMVSSVCHELYHRHQFTNSTPLSQISYVAKYFIGLFIPYQKQCTIPWTIQGEVREKVDNANNQLLHKQFDKVFTYLINAAKAYKCNIIKNTKKYKKYITNDIKQQMKNIQDEYKNSIKLVKDSNQLELILKLAETYDLFTIQFLNFIKNNK